MDVNQALENAREATRNVRTAIDLEQSPDELANHADLLAEAFDAIDQWLCGGGFKPTDWRES